MNILLLQAVSKNTGDFTNRMDSLTDYIIARGNSLVRYELSEMDLHYCTGCFNCWWKTPGRCIIHDDMEKLYPEIVKSDLLMFASPLVMGLPSWRVKQVQDRLIPLIHPYITLVNGECHHRKRYYRYPDISLVVQKEADTGTEDLELLKTLHRRLAINFHSTFIGLGIADATNQEVYNEACCI